MLLNHLPHEAAGQLAVKTQIICTVTEASGDVNLLKKMLQNGMSVARIKLDADAKALEVREKLSPLLLNLMQFVRMQRFEVLVNKVKAASKELGKPCAIFLDTKVSDQTHSLRKKEAIENHTKHVASI